MKMRQHDLKSFVIIAANTTKCRFSQKLDARFCVRTVIRRANRALAPYNFQPMNCNSCGSSNVIEGTISDSNGGNVSLFVPKEKPLYKKIFGIGTNKILSFACVHCGNLQFMVEFSEKDKQRYVEFEGRQPSLMERINGKLETSE